MTVLRTAYVYVRNVYAGELQETDEGYRFVYDSAYRTRPDATSVSLTLPLQEEVYSAQTLFPFFDGLIPEGWILQITVKNWKLEERDRFGILLVACEDCIGKVSVRKEKI